MNKEKINILIVVESIDINDSSATKGRIALINNLHALGFNLKVYHYTQKEIHLTNIDCVSIPENKKNIMYLLSRMQRVFMRITKLNINPLIEKLLGFSFIFFNDVRSIKKALKKEINFQPNWVLTLSKASSFRTHAALLAIPIWHSKWLAYVHDPYPMHFYPRPYNWVEPGYYQKQEFFREVSKKSAHAIFPSKLLQEWMGSYFYDFMERGIVIPHQIGAYQIQNLMLPNFFNAEYFTLFHAGSLMKQRDPKHLVLAFEIFLKKYPIAKNDSQLLFIGHNDYHKVFLDKFKKHLNIYIEGYLPFDTIYNLQLKASVNIILESKSEISPFLPGKFPHCVEANRPILLLSPYYSETHRLLGDNYLYWSEVDDVNRIAKLISALYFIWKEKKSTFELNRPDLKEYLSINQLRKSIKQL